MENDTHKEKCEVHIKFYNTKNKVVIIPVSADKIIFIKKWVNYKCAYYIIKMQDFDFAFEKTKQVHIY